MRFAMNFNQLLFLDISGGELFIVLIVVFLIFGPKQLPEMAKKLGKVVYDLKKASANISQEIKQEADQIKNEFINAKSDIEEETKKFTEDLKNESENIKQTINDSVIDAKKDLKK